MIIAIDFDGTIVEHEYPKIGKIKEGAKEAIQAFKDRGHHIIINTCRKGKEEAEAKEWMIMNGIPFDEFNEPVEGYDLGTRKLYADIYIDDKAVRFSNNWADLKTWIV